MNLIQNIFRACALAICLCLPLFTKAMTGPEKVNNATISGVIRTPLGLPILGALVEISDGVQTHVLTTDANGYYSLEVPPGNYSVRPYSDNSDYSNGVDSTDIELIRNHIFHVPEFNNPFKILASDVNMSGLITIFDLVLISRVITGEDPDFPAPSWRFLDAGYVFPDPQNPALEPLPEIVYLSPTEDTEINFIGFKMGDVNWDATTLSGVAGNVFLDEAGNCVVDLNAQPLKGWVVKARKVENGHLYYSSTNAAGAYRIPLPAGDYLVSLRPLNESWNACEPGVPVTVDYHSYEELKLSAKSIYACPVPTVDIAAPFLRRCFENQFRVNFSNNGSVVAENAYVTIAFDQYLAVTQSSIPWSNVSGNTYTFPIGDLPAGHSGYFYVTALLNCGAEPGKTHCVEARIYPDANCLPVNSQWDGSDLKINSHCDGDTLRFQIENLGSDMQQPAPYFVIVDDMIMMTGEVSLPSGEMQEIKRAADGATIRLILEQSPGHPGRSEPTLAVEGCGVNDQGSFSTGFVTQFPEDEADYNVSIYCAENIASSDPNDKQAFPKGVGEPHFIEPGQEIDYLIRFQNTGTDTAFVVVIRDTLSPILDPETLEMGASSHPSTWQLRGDGILTIAFNNILLPDSTANEAASHGFASFRIRQREGLALPALIHNTAAIYFDFNEAVITNEVTHTVDTNFLEVLTSVRDAPKPAPQWQLSPNPLRAGSPFQIKGILPQDGILILYDGAGKQTAVIGLRAGGTGTLPEGIPAGWYLLELRSENKVIGYGKVVVGF